MTTNIQTVNKVSDKYSTIDYTFCANNFIPGSGYLNHLLLSPTAKIITSIHIKESLVCDYKFATIMLAYKQVKSKKARKSIVDSIILRKELEADITNFITNTAISDFTETKILLLNDSVLDKDIGDTGLQATFFFEKHDGTHEFMLRPGAGIRNLTSMIGLGVWECDTINEVLDSMIFEMSDLCFQHIIPHSGIVLNDKLKEDIKRYLKFYLYCE